MVVVLTNNALLEEDVYEPKQGSGNHTSLQIACGVLAIFHREEGGFEGWVCDGRNISLPHSWNYSGEPTRFENVFTLERLRPNESCYLRAWFGGESLVLVDGETW